MIEKFFDGLSKEGWAFAILLVIFFLVALVAIINKFLKKEPTKGTTPMKKSSEVNMNGYWTRERLAEYEKERARNPTY